MRAFTYGVKVVEGLLGSRACLVLVLVFVSSIDRSSPSDVAPESERLISKMMASDVLPNLIMRSLSISHDAPGIRTRVAEMERRRISRSANLPPNSTRDAPSFRKPETLTNEQRKSVVTIEFNFKHIDRQNRTALNAAYREVRRKILEYLNSRKSTTVPPTTTPTAQTTTAVAPTTTATTSVVETTTETTTTVAATTSTTQAITTTPIKTTKSTTIRRTVSPSRKRRRSQNSGENDVIYTEEDLLFIENDPEIDENGILRISLLLFKDELGGIDLGELLHNTTNALNETGELNTAAGAPVVKINRRFPPKVEAGLLADYRVWLPILLAIVLLLIISTFVCCWMATNKKVKNDESKKIVPALDSKPDSSNGQVPRILDDNCGWLVPYEEFSYEQI